MCLIKALRVLENVGLKGLRMALEGLNEALDGLNVGPSYGP